MNIFYRMSFKEDIWKKLILSTLFSKFRHIPPWFLGAQKLIVIKDHLKKRIKQFPACNDFFLIWDIFCSHFDWAKYFTTWYLCQFTTKYVSTLCIWVTQLMRSWSKDSNLYLTGNARSVFNFALSHAYTHKHSHVKDHNVS